MRQPRRHSEANGCAPALVEVANDVLRRARVHHTTLCARTSTSGSKSTNEAKFRAENGSKLSDVGFETHRPAAQGRRIDGKCPRKAGGWSPLRQEQAMDQEPMTEEDQYRSCGPFAPAASECESRSRP